MNRKNTYLLKAGLALAGGALFARSEYEKKHFQIVTYRVLTDKLDREWDGKKIVFLSDLHDNLFGKHNKTLRKAIALENPQAILIGGDMLTVKPWKKKNFSELESLLCWLGQRYSVYYANGNHESRMRQKAEKYPEWYENFCGILKKAGVMHLTNNRETIMLGEKALYLYGLDLSEHYFEKGIRTPLDASDVASLLGEAKTDGFCLLLAHSPIYFEAYAKWGADLILSGHFHGGTIRIPGLGGLMSPQFQFFSKFNDDMVCKDGVPMIISAGLGTHSVNIRLNNQPQLVVLEWKTEDEDKRVD